MWFALCQAYCLAQVWVHYSLLIKSSCCQVRQGGLYGAPHSPFVAWELCRGFCSLAQWRRPRWCPWRSLREEKTLMRTHPWDADVVLWVSWARSVDECIEYDIIWYYTNKLRTLVKDGARCSDVQQWVSVFLGGDGCVSEGKRELLTTARRYRGCVDIWCHAV